MKLRMVVVASVLAVLWAVFWLFFLAESSAWCTPALAMASWVGVGLLFLVLAVAPWRWELSEGLMLVVAGLLIAVAYTIWAPPRLPLPSRVITTVVLGGPAPTLTVTLESDRCLRASPFAGGRGPLGRIVGKPAEWPLSDVGSTSSARALLSVLAKLGVAGSAGPKT